MSINKLIPTTLILFFVFLLSIPSYVSATHFDIRETDTSDLGLVSFFDLRERETFIQVTNTNNDVGDNGFTPGSNVVVHVQIFNVDDDCNENNFYDTYTPNDTHIYNMRDILTNDGNPSGVVLPENAYGFVVVTLVEGVSQDVQEDRILVGNFRVVDNAGYEYRTNSIGLRGEGDFQPNDLEDNIYTINFNTEGNVILSDINAISLAAVFSNGGGFSNVIEWSAELTDAWISFDVDIFNNAEVPFSCRDVIFACIDQDNPRLEELLEFAAEDGCCDGNPAANVASFEYGINNAIPHSKGSELLCPGNNISEGFVKLTLNPSDTVDGGGPQYMFLTGFAGLNNGNGRGSMDSWWSINCSASDECD